jgi:hypothetical protein
MANLLEDLALLRAQMSELKHKETALVSEIAQVYNTQITEQLADQDYGCGTATVEGAKFVIAKTVKWDQAGLKKLYEQIRAGNENPDEYINLKLDVAESKYKAWPTPIRKSFEPFRTVTPSKIKITLKGETDV